MKWMKLTLLPVLSLLLANAPIHAQSPRRTTELLSGWRFLQSDASGAQDPDFNDKNWQTVTVPHDWAIAGPFDMANPTGGAGAFLPSGISWYRRHIPLAAADANKRIYIEFDGVMAHSQVWLNGHLLGERPNGYVSFGYELTPYMHTGDNILAVRTDTSQQPASRWYEGAGIYRKVRLVVEDPIHAIKWGTYITASEVTAKQAQIHVQVQIANQSEQPAGVSLHVRLIAPDGMIAARTTSAEQQLMPGADGNFDLTMHLSGPYRWDIQHPVMYRAMVDVFAGNKLHDTGAVDFGIREFHFDPATGFWLNGKNLKIYGVALHEDAGAFGIAVPAEIYKERLLALRELGVNAIRTAHNPPSPEFLTLCDQLGFLVMDESFDMWSVAKNPYDYHLDFAQWHVQDTIDTAMRDRNHPSIILWSAGNEIHDTPNADLAKSELRSILDAFHQVDPSRPVTQALFRPNVSHDYDDGLADMLDVIGQNYRPNEILAAHAAKPTRKIIGTENTHDLDQWLPVRDHAEYSGEFVWSGNDYLGEARGWPGISRSTGLLDRTNYPHVRGLERQSWWSNIPIVHIARRTKPTPKSPTDPGYEAQQMGGSETVFADWTPESLAPHEEHVEVYSNCADVTLQLNGDSLGSKPRNADDSPRTWIVNFAPGTLRAVCGNAKKTAETLTTAGKPARILLTPASAQVGKAYDDAVTVRATVVDTAGIRVPRADTLLHFTVTGPGAVIAVDNGDNVSHEPFQATTRSVFDGAAVAYIRATAATGQIRITASADGLKSGSALLSAARP